MVMKNWTSYLGTAAFLLFMGTLVWIGFDLVRGQRERQQVAQQINEALQLQADGFSHAALAGLSVARDRWFSLQDRSSVFFLERVQASAFDFDSLFAQVHRGAGMSFSNIQVAAEAEKQYTLALLYDDSLEGVPGALVMEAFYTRNLELGWVGARLLVQQQPAQARSRLVAFFEENYLGPRYER
jgi:hypothetical protein